MFRDRRREIRSKLHTKFRVGVNMGFKHDFAHVLIKGLKMELRDACKQLGYYRARNAQEVRNLAKENEGTKDHTVISSSLSQYNTEGGQTLVNFSELNVRFSSHQGRQETVNNQIGKTLQKLLEQMNEINK